jgi:FKBP-type peptidyl-prolyl cis-trans isomerase
VGKVLLILIAICLFSPLEAAENDNQAGLNYWNGLSKDAVTTSSGLQYKALITGTGRKPKSNSKVTVHYRGLLLNGVTFDSSYDDEEPVSLGLRSVIKGWIEGLQLMPVGSVFVFMIPPELAYGDSSSGSIPPNSTLIFEIELFGVK